MQPYNVEMSAEPPASFDLRFNSNSLIFLTALAWSLFHLWYASSLPYILDVFILNGSQARAIHLAFAIFLAFSCFPLRLNSDRNKVSYVNMSFGLVAAYCAAYGYLHYAELADRPGAPTQLDLAVALIGIILLLEAARRTLGPVLVIVALVFIGYTFLGQYMPDVVAHKGASFSKGMSHFWLTSEGVFGIALGVSTSLVFMFVLFGSLLDRAGAGHYFIRASYAAMGHMRGGPAKAAVLASALTGMISGSSTANVVTTGTFTIPLMKRVGLSAEKAGAVEVASSTNGQLMPPVMGAAAFLMVEYVGISYLEVIKHAFLPAFISYIALIYIVHLEACKLDMQGVQRSNRLSVARRLLMTLTALIGLMVITLITYYGLAWIRPIAGEATLWVVACLLCACYIGLLYYASGVDDLHKEYDLSVIPPFRRTLRSGCYFILPIVLLMWCLTVERLSPALSVFWATVFLTIIVLTQKRILAVFRGQSGKQHSVYSGFMDLIHGLVDGAHKMIGIGIATAVAGIIVGTVTLTGVGFVMTDLIEHLSGGNMMLILLWTAGVSLILGMGLPTTANYIVVSSLMAPVIVQLGAENGLLLPLIAVHLFVFYFGILADDTPPVGIAAYAAASISRGDPIRTGIQGFSYDLRTAILPFMFIYNPELLLIGISDSLHLLIVVVSSTIALLIFCAATQGFFVTRSRRWESAVLLVLCLLVFRPDLVWNTVFPSKVEMPALQLTSIVEKTKLGDSLKLTVRGEDFDDGSIYTKVLVLPIKEGLSGAERLLGSGLEVREEDSKILVDNIGFTSVAEKSGFDFDQEIINIIVPVDRPAKQYLYIPLSLILILIIIIQRRRLAKQADVAT